MAELYDLWTTWVFATPTEPRKQDFMFSAALDANDDFRAAAFMAAHGYYRQGMGTIRGALEIMAIAAGFAVRNDWQQYERWQNGQHEPKFGNAVDFLAVDPRLHSIDQEIGNGGVFGKRPAGILKSLYGELCAFVHPQADSTNGAIWDSNGPVYVHRAFARLAEDCKDTVAMSYLLLAVGWPDFTIPEQAWALFDRPTGVWANVPTTVLRRHFQR